MSTKTGRKTLTAREYLRVSQDRSHRARSVDEQHGDNERAATDNGWTLAESYRDNDRSASRYAKKAREGYDQLIADLRADRFKADVLVLWESSRGSRKVSEWVVLLELLEARGVKIYVTSHGRTYDPKNHRDRRSLLEDSVDSEYESGKTSDRVRRAAEAAAKEGRPNGRAPFGYRRVYDERTRELVRQEPDPATAPLVRELFDKVHAGHSIRSISRDWEARGVTTRSGKPFTPSHLRSLLVMRAYVGERVHNPEHLAVTPDMVTEGIWEPIVDRATFEEVQDIITAPERRTTRPGRGVHLLSGIALCDVCGGRLASTMQRRDTGEYHCQKGGHVRVSEVDLDEVAVAVMLARLNDKELRAARAAAEDSSEALTSARAAVKAIRKELEALYADAEAGRVSPVLAGKFEKGLLARLAEAKETAKALANPADLDRLFPDGTTWASMPMSAKREVARRLLTIPQDENDFAIGELRLMRRDPSAGPRRVPAAERVRWFPPLAS